LKGLGGVFCRESPHHQRQLPVGRHLDRSPINPLHVLGGTNTAVIYLHNEFGVFHGLSVFPFLLQEIQHEMLLVLLIIVAPLASQGRWHRAIGATLASQYFWALGLLWLC
jgi:hypothetical protein